jgi:DNA-binding transcriptional LysR family regulator
MDTEAAIRLYVSVVEEGSFSRGGMRLGVAQSSTSRIIAKLETKLGVQLLQRSTRSITLTEAGAIYFERVKKILTELDEATDVIQDISAAPSGLLRITAPASFGRQFVAPYFQEFNQLYPDITIGLSLADAVEDVVKLGYDVAIRLGELSDSGLIAKLLTKSTSTVCASPAYLVENGTPQNVDELRNFNCLQFRSDPGENKWSFIREEKIHDIKVSGSFFSNNGDALLAAAHAGLGIVYLPDWMVGGSLEDGSLVRVLPDYQLNSKATPIHALFAHRSHTPAKVRAFTTFLKAKLSVAIWAN